MDRFRDRVVIVTGVTGGIGFATASSLVEAGATVAVSGRDASKLSEAAAELGGGVLAVAADLTDEADVAALLGRVHERHGRADAFVHVPGVSVPAPVAEMDAADYDRVFDVNAKTAFLCAKHYVRRVDPDRGGQLVIVSSTAGKQANPTAPVYCASKAAVDMLASGLQMQAKAANVRVSLVSPGAVSTPGFWGDRDVPHDKFLRPEDVAAMVTMVVGLPPRVVLQDVVFQPWDLVRST